ETLPILLIFLVLISYAIGYFGIVHTSVLNSISARTYAFETFRNRTNLVVFRDNIASVKDNSHFAGIGNRVHAISTDDRPENAQNVTYATSRRIAFGRKPADIQTNSLTHNEQIYDIRGRNRQGGVEVSPAWVMVSY